MPVKIDHSKCNICGRCIFQCGRYVFQVDIEKRKLYPKRAAECIDCFVCYLICPRNAIRVFRKKNNLVSTKGEIKSTGGGDDA